MAFSAFAGGTAQSVQVVSLSETGAGEHVFKFTDASDTTRTLHVHYNSQRLRGVVSAQEHKAAIELLQQQISRSKVITFGLIGGSSFDGFPERQKQLVCDALQIHDGVIYAWPAKR